MKGKFLLVFFFSIVSVNFPQSPCTGIPIVAYANKTYHTVQIGSQCWLKENIDVGTMINSALTQTNNSILEKYCYDDDPNNCELYGGLYNWNEAMKYTTSGPKVQGICPSGWRLPTMDELKALVTFVNNDGSSLKDVTQGVGTSTGTNTSGFTALLAGSRGAIRSNGSYFSHLQVYAFFWSSTEYDAAYAFVTSLDYSNNNINLWGNGKEAAFSVRCIQGDGVTSASEKQNVIKNDFRLFQNYPNPFNPSTVIIWQLVEGSHVTLKIYDLIGREVATLVDEFQHPGIHNSAFSIYNYSMPSGVYYYQLNAGGFVKTNKFILLK